MQDEYILVFDQSTFVIFMSYSQNASVWYIVYFTIIVDNIPQYFIWTSSKYEARRQSLLDQGWAQENRNKLKHINLE